MTLAGYPSFEDLRGRDRIREVPVASSSIPLYLLGTRRNFKPAFYLFSEEQTEDSANLYFLPDTAQPNGLVQSWVKASVPAQPPVYATTASAIGMDGVAFMFLVDSKTGATVPAKPNFDELAPVGAMHDKYFYQDILGAVANGIHALPGFYLHHSVYAANQPCLPKKAILAALENCRELSFLDDDLDKVTMEFELIAEPKCSRAN